MSKTLTASVEVEIGAPPSLVWRALTSPELIARYLFGTKTETEWKVGGAIRFSGEHQGKTYEDKGTVLAFEPEKSLKYSYLSSLSGKEDKPENYMIVSFSINPISEKKTVLVLNQENIADESTREHSENNWRKVLATLKDLLEDGQQVAAY